MLSEDMSLRWRIILVVAVAGMLALAPIFIFVSRQLRPAPALAVIGLVGGVGVSAVLYVLLDVFVLRPLKSLVESANEISEGSLTAVFPVARDDEIGAVASAFSDAADRLRVHAIDLEQRLVERTASLERRAMQLEAVSLVSQEAAQARNVPVLLETTVGAISEKFGFYHVGIFILDDAKTWAILRAASSEGGRRMLARGHRLRVGQAGIVGFVSSSGKPRIAFNVGEDAVWFDNPDLPGTRSEMAVPLKMEDEVVGILDVQSEEAAAFTDEDISTLQLMADQLAVALDNARALETMESALAEVHELHVDYSRQGWARIASLGRPLAYEYDRVDVNPVPPLPVPQALLDERVTQTAFMDGGVPVVMEALRAGGRVLGYLGLTDSQRIWSDEELSLVESVGEQVAMALENARLFEESQQSQRQQTLISNVLQVASDPELSFEQVLTEIARVLAQALGMAVGVCTFPQANVPRFQPHAVLDPSGKALPFSQEVRTLSDEHRIFFRGLTRIELGPMSPLLVDEEREALDAESLDFLAAFDLARVFYVPLGTPGALSGFVAMIQYRENALPLDPDTRALVQRLASQIEVVLENLTLTEETQQRSEELQSLYRISLVLSELLEPSDVLSAIVEQGANLLDADAGAFFAYDAESDGLELSFDYRGGAAGYVGHRLQREEGLAGKALAQQETLCVDDYETWGARVPALQSASFRAMMAVPLVGRFGPLGVLMLRSVESAAFGEREVRLSNLFAQQAAAALDNARLNRDAQQRAEEFSLLSQAGIDLLPIRDIEGLLTTAADWTRRIFDVPRVVIFLKDEANNRYLRGRSVEGPERLLVEDGGTPSPGGFTERVMTSNQSILVHDNRENSGETSRRLVASGMLSQMGVPLRAGDEVLGVIFVNGVEAHQFDERDLNLLEFLSTQVASAIQNVLQFARTEAALAVVRRQARYQANVSQAAALLTENGTGATSDVLRLLSEASGVEAAIYFEFHAETGDLHWQAKDMWMASELVGGMADNPLMSYLPLGDVQTWAEQLIENPFITIKVETLPETERMMFQALGMGAILLLAVRGEESYPNVIVLGRTDAETSWADEEVVALQTAVVMLSNTIARERVFQEVQTSRTETEALYRGSAELNLAQTYDDILSVVRNYTALGQGAHHVTLQLFDHPWVGDNESQYSEVMAHWTTTDISVLRDRYYMADFPSSREFVRSSTIATAIEDVAHDPRLSRRTRALFSRIFKVKSVVYVPMIAGGQMIGFLHAMYPHQVHFAEQELRRLESLTRQAAIATQNRLQLLSIEARVNRERMIREITERIQAAPDVQGVLQAAVRELGRAFGTSRNRIQFRPPGKSQKPGVGEGREVGSEGVGK